MNKSKLTHGGFYASEAHHWNQENHQKLGDILYRLLCGNPQKRHQARIDFFRMKRHFMLDEWDEYIDKVDRHREQCGVKTLTQFIDDSSGEMFDREFNPDPEDFHLPDQSSLLSGNYTPQHQQPAKKEPEPTAPYSGEQLSLF